MFFLEVLSIASLHILKAISCRGQAGKAVEVGLDGDTPIALRGWGLVNRPGRRIGLAGRPERLIKGLEIGPGWQSTTRRHDASPQMGWRSAPFWTVFVE